MTICDTYAADDDDVNDANDADADADADAIRSDYCDL